MMTRSKSYMKKDEINVIKKAIDAKEHTSNTYNSR